MRKIIQVCAIPGATLTGTNAYGDTSDFHPISIFALCSDGSVWETHPDLAEWKKLPDIPQDEDYTCVVCGKKITENPVSASMVLHPKQRFKHADCNFRSGW